MSQELDTSGPSIPEMRDMLAKPPGLDFYPLSSRHMKCEKCGTEKADWWLIVNGHRYCRECSRTAS